MRLIVGRLVFVARGQGPFHEEEQVGIVAFVVLGVTMFGIQVGASEYSKEIWVVQSTDAEGSTTPKLTAGNGDPVVIDGPPTANLTISVASGRRLDDQDTCGFCEYGTCVPVPACGKLRELAIGEEIFVTLDGGLRGMARVEKIFTSESGQRAMTLVWDDVVLDLARAFELTVELDSDASTCSGCYLDLHKLGYEESPARRLGAYDLAISDDAGRGLQDCAPRHVTSASKLTLQLDMCDYTAWMVCNQKATSADMIDGSYETMWAMFFGKTFYAGSRNTVRSVDGTESRTREYKTGQPTDASFSRCVHSGHEE